MVAAAAAAKRQTQPPFALAAVHGSGMGSYGGSAQQPLAGVEGVQGAGEQQQQPPPQQQQQQQPAAAGGCIRWRCPFRGCTRVYTGRYKLSDLRAHHRAGPDTHGHAEELSKCPRCETPLGFKVRHGIEACDAVVAAAAAAKQYTQPPFAASADTTTAAAAMPPGSSRVATGPPCPGHYALGPAIGSTLPPQPQPSAPAAVHGSGMGSYGGSAQQMPLAQNGLDGSQAPTMDPVTQLLFQLQLLQQLQQLQQLHQQQQQVGGLTALASQGACMAAAAAEAGEAGAAGAALGYTAAAAAAAAAPSERESGEEVPAAKRTARPPLQERQANVPPLDATAAPKRAAGANISIPVPQQQPAKVTKKRRNGLQVAVDAGPQPKRARGKKAAKD